jgi:hypothetical protein
MLYLFRLLLLLINIDQETVLNWFGMKILTIKKFSNIENGYDLNISNFDPSTNVSIDTFRLIIKVYGKKFKMV